MVSTDIFVDSDTFVNSYFGLSFDLRRYTVAQNASKMAKKLIFKRGGCDWREFTVQLASTSLATFKIGKIMT